MQAFAVVIALLSVAAVGWLLSRAARGLLRRHGVPTDERDVRDPSSPAGSETARSGTAGASGAGEPPRD